MEKAPVSETQEIIRAEGMTIGYGESIVLDNIDLTVREGEVLTVLGPSGCGKSTLLKALSGLIVPSKGRIRINGEEITSRDPKALSQVRRNIGVLFQSGGLLESISVAANVALPLEELTRLPRKIIDRVVQLKLDLVDLGGKGHLMPSELSGGMKKRAGLARAMALDPKILFCDEPSSGLDPRTALTIDQLLIELNTALGMTMVVVTHELASIENIYGRCIMLGCDERRIIASGSLEDLRTSTDPSVSSYFKRKIEEPR